MERGIGVPIILGNIFFTILGVFALKLGGWSGVAIVFLAGAYFPLSSSMLILASSGGLRDVLMAAIERGFRVLEVVVLISWYKWQAGRGLRVEHQVPTNLIEVTPSAYSTFVPAISPKRESTKQQAQGWLMSLCDDRTGDIRPDKVHMTNSSHSAGWLKDKAPTGDVREYLMSRGILKKVPNGIALNLDRVGNSRDIEGAIAD